MSDVPVLSRFHGIILRIPKLLPHVENLQAVFGLFKGLHPFVLRVQQGDGRLLAVIFRPGRSEVRILPVSPRAAPYGVLLLVLCTDFMGQQKRGIRAARAPRLGESLRARQKAHCNVLLQCAFCFIVI